MSYSISYSYSLVDVLTFYENVDAQQELHATLITVIECEGTWLVLIKTQFGLSFFLCFNSNQHFPDHWDFPLALK